MIASWRTGAISLIHSVQDSFQTHRWWTGRGGHLRTLKFRMNRGEVGTLILAAFFREPLPFLKGQGEYHEESRVPGLHPAYNATRPSPLMHKDILRIPGFTVNLYPSSWTLSTQSQQISSFPICCTQKGPPWHLCPTERRYAEYRIMRLLAHSAAAWIVG